MAWIDTMSTYYHPKRKSKMTFSQFKKYLMKSKAKDGIEYHKVKDETINSFVITDGENYLWC